MILPWVVLHVLFGPLWHLADNLGQDGMRRRRFDLPSKIQCRRLLSRLRPNVYQIIKGCLRLRNGFAPLPVGQTLLHLVLDMRIVIAT